MFQCLYICTIVCNVPIIILGGLNCKHEAWGCNKTNPKGRRLLTAATDCNVTIVAPNEPTHYSYDPNVWSDILDIEIFKKVTRPSHMTPIVDLDSDHLPVTVSFNEPPVLEPLQDKRIRRIVDWGKTAQNTLFRYNQLNWRVK